MIQWILTWIILLAAAGWALYQLVRTILPGNEAQKSGHCGACNACAAGQCNLPGRIGT